MSSDSLKKLRFLKGLSISEIAKLVHKTKQTVENWDCGKAQIPPLAWDYLLLKFSVTEQEIDTVKLPPNEGKNKSAEGSESELLPFPQFKKNLFELMESTHRAEQKKARKTDIKFIDLFAGIGGIRSAFERNGAKCVYSSEINIFAQYTYFANYGVVPYGDITKIKAEDIPDHDILCAGFPCQPFSHIGKREGFKHPTQGTMFYEIVRILEAKKPRAIFLENVPGLMNHDDGKTLKVILNSLKDLGYKCQYTTLNAKDFGIPQSRERFYLVGFLDNTKFEFPTPPMTKVNIGDFLESNVTGYEITKYLQEVYLFKKDDGRPTLIDKNTKGPMKTLVCSYHKIQRLTGTFVKDGPTGVRLLTASECKAAMGFPANFKLPVSRTQMYRQMGNSVVVKVIEAIAKNLMASLKSH